MSEAVAARVIGVHPSLALFQLKVIFAWAIELRCFLVLAQNVSFYIKFLVTLVIIQNRRRNVSKMASSSLKDVSEDDIMSMRIDPRIVLAVFVKIHLHEALISLGFVVLALLNLTVGFILFLLTNLNAALTSVTMYEQTTKDCAP